MSARVDVGGRYRKRQRSKDGCLVCRLRRKKCDGRKPTCLGCERNILLCSWAQEPRETLVVCTSEDDATYATTATLGENNGCETPPARRRRSYRDSPITPNIELVDIYEPAFGGHMLRDDVSRMLYLHWLHVTANNLSALQGHQNAFITELPKLALSYPDTVLPSLLALSGVHYSNRVRESAVEVMTWTRLAQALQALKYGVTKLVMEEEDNALPLLTTTLVLCFIETVRGDVQGNISHHLRAARPLLINVLNTHRLDHSMLSFIKEFYAYIACISDLNAAAEDNDCMPLIGMDSLNSSGMLVGCAHKLFELMPKVSTLARLARRRHSLFNVAGVAPGLTSVTAEAEASATIQRRVLAWEPPAGSHPDFATCGKVYQQALLVYLHASLSQSGTAVADTVRQSFDSLLKLLSMLPRDAPISATLCWPLAIFGSLAREVEDREAIRGRLEAMWELLGLGNIKATIGFLDHLWKDVAAGEVLADPSDLDGLMKRYGVQISFV